MLYTALPIKMEICGLDFKYQNKVQENTPNGTDKTTRDRQLSPEKPKPF